MIHIGLKIKELMEKNNIDAPKLATKLGKTKQAVYAMIEREDINTSLLKDISSIFDVPLSFFFTDSENKIDCEQEKLKQEIISLKQEIKRLQELKLPTKDDKALDVSRRFFEATKEMFSYFEHIKE